MAHRFARLIMAPVLLVLLNSAGLAIDRERPEDRPDEVKPQLARLKHEYARVRISACKTLQKFERPDDAKAAIEALCAVITGDKDAEVRAAAVAVMGEQHWRAAAKGAVPVLINALKDEDVPVCVQATQTLCLVGDKEALEAIQGMLKHDDARVRTAAAEGIGSLAEGDELMTMLLAAVEDKDHRVRAAAAYSLMRFQADSKVRDRLIKCMNEDHPKVRVKATHALNDAIEEDERVVKGLLAMLKDRDEELRTAAASALTGRKSIDVAKSILAALETEPMHQPRRAMIRALGSYHEAAAIDTIAEVLVNAKECAACRSSAAQALGAINDKKAVPALLRAVETSKSYLRPSMLAVLLELDPKSCVEPSAKLMLADATPEYERGTYAQLLGRTKDPEALKILEKALTHRNSMIRGVAAEALGNFGNQATDALLKATEDKNSYVVSNAIKSLGKSDDPRVMPVVLKFFKDNRASVWQAARSVLRDRKHPAAENRTPTGTR